MKSKFPKPWKLQQTGPTDFVVTDANGRKLFYVVDDQDAEDENTVLGSSDRDDDETILNELEEMLGRLE